MILLLALIAHASLDQALEHTQDGRFVEAARIVEKTRAPRIDKDQVLGYIALRANDPAQAKRLLTKVVEQDAGRAAAWLYLGIAEHQLEDPAASLRALKRASSVGAPRRDYWALRARNERLVTSDAVAYETLTSGLSRFERDPVLLREQVSILVAADAVATALLRAELLFEVSPNPQRDRLWLARLFVDADALEAATSVLEVARLAQPNDPDLAAQLAYVYARRGRHHIAARLLDPSRIGAGRAFESADQYRVAGEHTRALRANRFVVERGRRLAQRVQILVESGALEEAAALGSELEGEVDERTAFALAFAYVNTGELERAEGLLNGIERPDDWPGLDELRQTIEVCRRDEARCP